MTTATPSKLRRKSLFLWSSTVLMVIFALTTTLAREMLGPIALPIGAVCALVAMVCALGYFANMDELGQRAQYIAWFWGGTLGLSVLAAGVIASLLSGADWNALIAPVAERYWGGADVRGGFAAGVTLVLMLQLIGATLWWLGYWARKR